MPDYYLIYATISMTFLHFSTCRFIYLLFPLFDQLFIFLPPFHFRRHFQCRAAVVFH